MNQEHEQTILSKGSPDGKKKKNQKKVVPAMVREIKLKTKLRNHSISQLANQQKLSNYIQ